MAQDDFVVSIEGSTTAGRVTPAEDGTLAHTNHYVHPDMLGYEASDRVEGSVGASAAPESYSTRGWASR